MKTLSQLLTLSVFSLVAFVACNKKSGGGDSSPAPVVTTCVMGQALPANQYCNNGQIITQPNTGGGNLLNNVQFANSYMQGAVSLAGSGNFDWNNPGIVNYYGGPLALSGMVQVMSNSLCGAPQGTYTLSGQGQISMGTISNTMVTLTGPAQMQLTIGTAYLQNAEGSMDRNSNNNRLLIYYSNLVVNGQPCGGITSY